MDVWDLTRTMARRWWVVVPCLLVTAVTALVVVRTLPTDHVVTASVVLTAPPQPVDLGIRDGAGSQVTPAGVIAELLQGPAVREAVAAAGATSAYTAEGVGHIVRVTATSGDPAQVGPTTDAVLDAIPAAVAEREDALGVPEATRTAVEIIRRPAGAEPVPAPGIGFQAVGAALLRPGAVPENPVTPSEFTALLLAEAVQGAPTRERIRKQGLLGGYEVSVDGDGPLLRLTATGSEEQPVLDTVDAVVSALDEELAERQEAVGVPAAQQVTLQPVVVPREAQQRTGSPVGSLVAILGLGLVTAAGLAVLAERVAGRRGGWPADALGHRAISLDTDDAPRSPVRRP